MGSVESSTLEEFLGQMGPRDFELLGWSYELDPPLGKRIDQGFAMLGYLLANQWVEKATDRTPFSAFLPPWDLDRAETFRPENIPIARSSQRVRTLRDLEEGDAEDLGGEERDDPGRMSTAESVQSLINGFASHGMYAPRYKGEQQVLTLQELEQEAS